MDTWRILKDNPKWTTYCDMLNKEKNSISPINVLDLEDLPRPVGSKAAKANRNGERKMPESVIVMVEELDKFIQAHSAYGEDRDGMKEFQQRMLSERLEAAKLAHKAAKEEECKMVDAYKELLLADTSKLDDDAKAERAMALTTMRLKLFGADT